MIDPDDWPCGLLLMDGSGLIQTVNVTLRQWLALDVPMPGKCLRFDDILSRAGRIYFETHLRPLLLLQGYLSEISIELERSDGTRVAVFMNGRATLSDGRMISVHLSMFQNEQRRAFEHELVAKRRESEAFKVLVGSAPYAIMYVGIDRIIRAWNAAAEQLFGYHEAEVIGRRFDEILIPPEDLPIVLGDMQRIVSGETVRSEAVRLHKSGERIDVERSISTIHDLTKEYSGFVATYIDIRARKASEAHIKTLLHEVNHRSKNLLTVVQVIARQTGRLHAGPDFLSLFNKRLASLTLNQDILINSQGGKVDLTILARAQFAHLMDPSDPRVTINGPPVQINESASQAIGMSIFELVTNSAKYGGLSQDSGSVDLLWVISEEIAPDLEISWVERGGPPVTEPTREGFGSQVTGPILESATSGKTRRNFDPSGFSWSLRAPLGKLTS